MISIRFLIYLLGWSFDRALTIQNHGHTFETVFLNPLTALDEFGLSSCNVSFFAKGESTR